MTPLAVAGVNDAEAARYASPELIASLTACVREAGAETVGPVIRDLVHELRQPLSAMRAIGDLLLQRSDVPVEARAWIRLILDQDEAMFGLCREIVTAVEAAP